jgi:hypothetical protein
MGLDSFWKLPKGRKQPLFKPDLHLIGGIFSGFGKGSFRGKVYAGLIEVVTGESLYHETIPNTTIKEMADKMQVFNMTPEMWEEWKPYEDDNIQEWHDLVRMFRAYADAGASLHGWW